MDWSLVALIGSWIATPIIFVAYLPGSIKTIKTRQTHGIGLMAFSLLIFGLFCLSTFGWVLVGTGDIANIAENIAFALFETGSLVFSSSILTVKIINMIKAKKLNITEEQYCKNLLPKKVIPS